MIKSPTSRLTVFALTALLGLSAPFGLDIAAYNPATASPPPKPTGTFVDSEWSIQLFEDMSRYFSYEYLGTYLADGSRLRLSDGRHTENWTEEREEWVWYNGDYQYIIAWRPNDRHFIRLRVIDPNGVEILNRLLERDRY
jgi:hypothetical protein